MGRGTLVSAAFLAVIWPQQPAPSVCEAIPPAAPIVEVGTFSNLRYTEEHEYGEVVRLWRSGDCLFGIFEAARGLSGGRPVGELQGVSFDSSTGALRFVARLTLGVIPSDGSPSQPSRDLFTFDGSLGLTRIVGTITHANQLYPNPPVRSIVMPASAKEAEFTQGSATYGAWRERWAPILELRGPKW